MPWNETTKNRERVRFIGDLERDLFSMTELCRRYGISRETGYKWVNRYFEEGPDGLKDRSRAPKTCPHRTDAFIVGLLADARGRHPSWGPKKLLIWLTRRHRGLGLPAVSTAGDILKRLGVRRTSKFPPSRTLFNIFEVSSRRLASYQRNLRR